MASFDKKESIYSFIPKIWIALKPFTIYSLHNGTGPSLLFKIKTKELVSGFYV
jgi:hypothetical protein